MLRHWRRFPRGFRQGRYFETFAAIQLLVGAHDDAAVQHALERDPELLVSRPCASALRRLSRQLRRAGREGEAWHLDALRAVVDDALREGIPAAIAKAKLRRQQRAEACMAVLLANRWELANVVRTYLPVLSQGECRRLLHDLDAQWHAEHPAPEEAHVVALRSLNVQYVDDAVRKGLRYADRQLKRRYDALVSKAAG
jgi:hypothetical protein